MKTVFAYQGDTRVKRLKEMKTVFALEYIYRCLLYNTKS